MSAQSDKGDPVLEHTALQYILRTDPLLGSTDNTVADGPFNRELEKLIENDKCAAAHFVSYVERTTANDAGAAHVVGSPPTTPTGAPTTPTNLSYHEVRYSDFSVVYWYNAIGGLWTELGRKAITGLTATRVTKTVQPALSNGISDITFAMPTDDDAAQAFTWALNDVKNVYLHQNDGGAPVVAVKGALRLSGSSITVYFDAALVDAADYTLNVLFEKVVIS